MSFDIEKYKMTASKILFPIKPADNTTEAADNFLFTASRSEAGRMLPEYFLVYFLFGSLLDFKNLCRFEKISWSFPIDYKGRAFLVEYRKFGLGIFVQHPHQDELATREIAKKINGAVKSIRPYYDYLAEQAVKKSEFNIVNNNQKLFSRFEYLLSLYHKEQKKYLKNKDAVTTVKKASKVIFSKSSGGQYRQHANYLAVSCIEAFFSWTEHLFIHLSVVAENFSDGMELARLIEAEWKVRYKAAIKNNSKQADAFFEELLLVRQQLRNFAAHSTFGKDGNAFRFHSEAGAVPVSMNHKKKRNRFSLNGLLK